MNRLIANPKTVWARCLNEDGSPSDMAKTIVWTKRKLLSDIPYREARQYVYNPDLNLGKKFQEKFEYINSYTGQAASTISWLLG